ncbi:hypothetical protein CC86DRAFT_433761, partial [Ophiobolus disseminans]
HHNAPVTASTTTHCYRVHPQRTLPGSLPKSTLYTTTASAIATESNPAVTRVTVILNTPDD